MRTLKTGIVVPEKITVVRNGLNEECDLFRAGSYHAVYLTADKATVIKVLQSVLDPVNWERNEEGRKLARLVALTDSPRRNVRLWNTYTLPLLQAAAIAAHLNEKTLPELTEAALCTVLIDGLRKKAWSCPLLAHEGAALTAVDFNRFLVESYRGRPALKIRGGRILGDVTCGNVIRWKNVLVPIDFGAFFTLTGINDNTLHREASQTSLDVWYDDSDAEEDTNFNRAQFFRGWLISKLMQMDANKSTYLLTAALFFAAENAPEYLDISIFLNRVDFRNHCAILFVENKAPSDWFKKVFPDLTGLMTAKTADSLRYADIIAAYRREKTPQEMAALTKNANESQESYARLLANLQTEYEIACAVERPSAQIVCSLYRAESLSKKLQKIIYVLEKSGVDADFSQFSTIDFSYMATEFEGYPKAQEFCRAFAKINDLPLQALCLRKEAQAAA